MSVYSCLKVDIFTISRLCDFAPTGRSMRSIICWILVLLTYLTPRWCHVTQSATSFIELKCHLQQRTVAPFPINAIEIHLNSPLSIHFISNFNLPGKPFTGCKRNFNFHFLAKHTIAAQHRHLKQTNIFIPNTCSMYFSGTCLQKGVFSMEETHT